MPEAPSSPAEPALPAVVREIVLDVGLEEAWHLVSDAAELRTWLGSEVLLDLRVGGAGSVEDPDGSVRHLLVERVEANRVLAFRWWPEADPAGASSVSFELEQADGGTRLTVVERAPAGARMCACADAGSTTTWDVRLLALEVGAFLRARACGGAVLA